MYQVKIAHIKDVSFEVQSGSANFIIDAQPGGLTPPDALLAALGSCVGVYIHKYSQGSKLGLENFDISVEAEFAKESPIGFKEIKVAVDLKGAKLDERRKLALLEFVKNCPVHNTLRGDPEVKIKLS